MAKGAIRTHHTSTTAGDWDGPATEARIPNDTEPRAMQTIYAWVDPDLDPETKQAYKFPHHEVTKSGRAGAANEKACISGIGILNGGRGGADIPKEDREKIYRHLAAHLKDAGRDPAPLKS